MNKHKLVHAYTILLTAGVLAVFVIGPVLGQGDETIGRFVPFVIDISQAVPVEVAVPVVLDNGETITATTPLTVAVELRVRVDGPQQAQVEVLSAPEPTVAVATATPLAAVEGQAGLNDDVLVGEVRWRITAAEDMGNTLKSNNTFAKDKSTPGRFIRLAFEVENQSSAPKTFTFSSISLVDSEGRSYDTMNDVSFYSSQDIKCSGFDQLNPGLPKQCETIYEVPASANGLKASVGDLEMFGGEEAFIDVGL